MWVLVHPAHYSFIWGLNFIIWAKKLGTFCFSSVNLTIFPFFFPHILKINQYKKWGKKRTLLTTDNPLPPYLLAIHLVGSKTFPTYLPIHRISFLFRECVTKVKPDKLTQLEFIHPHNWVLKDIHWMDCAAVGAGSLWRNSLALQGASHRRLPVTVFTVVKEVGGMGTTGRAEEWSESTPSNRLDAPDFISQVSETSPPLWNRPRSFFFLLLYPSVAFPLNPHLLSLTPPSLPSKNSSLSSGVSASQRRSPSVPLGGFLKLLQRFQGELRFFFLHFFPLPKRIESSGLFLLSSYVSLRFGLTIFSCFLRVQEMALFFPRAVMASDVIAWLFAVVFVWPIDSWKFYALPPL